MVNRNLPAVAMLCGLPLTNGWIVKKEIDRSPHASGGTFSHSYLVEKEGKQGFLKAFDFSHAFESGKNTIEIISALTGAYEHEKEILQICAEKRLSKVVIAIDYGDVQVPNYNQIEGKVFYLIFEMADGDIRAQVDTTKRFDALWSMHAVKDVCLGLWQVHKQMIAHQDAKPSNILVYKGEGFRISDFGRSSRNGRNVVHDEFAVAGDRNYSPPELLYGYTHSEFVVRRFGCDLYLLGNLAAFMLAGVNMTASILARLDKQFHPNVWNRTYSEVLPYIQQAFTCVLEDLKPQIDPIIPKEVWSIIQQLCNPDLSRRGHPRGLGNISEQYSLERYSSQFDRLLQQTQLMARRAGLNQAPMRKAG